MPQSRRSKPGSRTTSAGDALQPYLAEIDRLEGFDNIARIICKALHLPDLDTRAGLKKIHGNFSEIQTKLNAAYKKNLERPKVLGGIVAIWTRMSVDVLLQTRLFDGGFLARLMSLLGIESTRIFGLQALLSISRKCGTKVLPGVAKEVPILLRLAQEFPNSLRIGEMVVGIVYTAVMRTSTDGKEHHTMRQHLGTHFTLKVIVPMLEHRSTSPDTIGHCVTLLSVVGLSLKTADLESFPSLIPIIVALLRTSDIIIRCAALVLLFALDGHEAEWDEHPFHPGMLMQAITSKGIPSGLKQIMNARGASGGKCDIELTLSCTIQFRKAMDKCCEDHDLCTFGETVAGLITTSENSVTNGTYETYDERMGTSRPRDTGLPFTFWPDSLPHSANALRRRGNPGDLDTADILDLKYLLCDGRDRLPDAVALAGKAVARNPDVAYFYFGLGFNDDPLEAIRALKRGLKAKRTTPYVRQYLLSIAIDHAADYAMGVLVTAYKSPQRYAEGVAFLMSAFEDAKVFLAEAAPDNLHMHNIIHWYIIISLLIQGPEISPDLRELNDAFQKLDTAREFSKLFDHVPCKTQSQLTVGRILPHYLNASKDYSTLTSRLDAVVRRDASEDQAEATNKAEDNLAAWMDGLEMDGCGVSFVDEFLNSTLPHVDPKDAAKLYLCSWCGNPSVALRKCSGCAQTRYCDSSCQRAHWQTHKVPCKSHTSS